MSRSYTQRTIKILSMRSGGICAHPECPQKLIIDSPNHTDPEAVIGQIAHIFSYSNGGPRPNPKKNIKARNDYENLLFLCSNHHLMVDHQENQYPTDVLLEWKQAHEEWIQNRIVDKVPSVTSAELEIVTKTLLATPSSPTEDFRITTPAEKMRKNGLTSNIQLLVLQGMAGASDVEKFVHHMTMLSPTFSEGLKAGFVIKYNELISDGIYGDTLFLSLMEATGNGKFNPLYQAACLSVLVYLFQKCEIFEK